MKFVFILLALCACAYSYGVDPDFGLVRVDFAGARDTAYSVVEAHQSYYLVGPARTDSNDVGLAKINRCGNIIYKVTTDLGGNGSRADIPTTAILHKNKILVGGTTQMASVGNDLYFSLARYLENGNLDTTFGNNGIVLANVDEGGVNDEIFDLAIDEDDRIIATGFSNPGQVVGAGPAFNFGTLALHHNGVIDTSFGNNGRLITSFGPQTDDRGRAVIVTKQNKILLGGRTRLDPSPNFNLSLAQYDLSGNPDKKFGKHGSLAIKEGEVVMNFGLNSEILKMLPMGNDFLAAGNADGQFLLVKFKKDGRVDPSFNVVKIKFNDNAVNSLYGIFYNEDENEIFMVGNSRLNGIDRPAMARVSRHGQVKSTHIFEFPQLTSGFLRSGLIDENGNIIVAGEGVSVGATTSDMIIFKIQP